MDCNELLKLIFWMDDQRTILDGMLLTILKSLQPFCRKDELGPIILLISLMYVQLHREMIGHNTISLKHMITENNALQFLLIFAYNQI